MALTREPAGPVVEIDSLTKTFQRRGGEAITPVDDISLSVDAGEFVVLLGPSGCGKTTLLRCVAGLEHPDAGTIRIGGRTVFSGTERVMLPPEQRSISVVFQSYALWPHMTVFKNVAYPMRRRKVPAAEIRERVEHMLKLVGVGHLGDQYPGQLSGGQQQRVALARALAAESEVILFDEPLSNVDAKVRDQLRGDLLSMQEELGFAALYVTHDQVEAMELGHRIAILNQGKVEQLASPREAYLRPANRYVADFVGRANEIPGTVHEVAGTQVVLDTALGLISAASSRTLHLGDSAHVILRPEAVAITVADTPTTTGLRATVVAVLFSGATVRVIVDVLGRRIESWLPSHAPAPDVGDTVQITWSPQDCWAVPDSGGLR